MTSGAVTLRQIHGTREMLIVRCDRYGRSGRYRVATLVRHDVHTQKNWLAYLNAKFG